MKIAILGSGLVGKPLAIDLAKDKKFFITCFDNNSSKFNGLSEYGIQSSVCDLRDDEKLAKGIKGFDLVINAVPGFMGFETLKSIIKAGKNVVDIAFYDRDPFELQMLAEQKGVTAIVDAGISPGLSNLLIGEAKEKFDVLESVKIYVGGLPKEKDGLYNYKAVFSPTDVLEEYVRPARIVENGRVITKPALSDLEEIEFEQTGILEAFNSDGLRSLIKTIDCPNMVEKTLRYPGHVSKIKLLSDSGFLNKAIIKFNSEKINPFYYTACILSKLWELSSDDKDITILRVELSGKNDNSIFVLRYDVYDEYNELTKTHSMARTTGYVATMCARMLAEGIFSGSGIFPLELLGKNKSLTKFIKNGLKQRGISINEK